MAIIETGLGWYADSAWLANQAGEIGKIETSAGGSWYRPGGGEVNLGRLSNNIITIHSDTTFFVAPGWDPVYGGGTYSGCIWAMSTSGSYRAHWNDGPFEQNVLFQTTREYSYTYNGVVYTIYLYIEAWSPGGNRWSDLNAPLCDPIPTNPASEYTRNMAEFAAFVVNNS